MANSTDAPSASAAPMGQADKARLFVFLHTNLKAAALKAQLGAQLTALTITGFGRYRDFEQAVASERPDAVLGLSPLLDAQKWQASLQGLRGGKDWESYSIAYAGIDAALPLSSQVLGVVDFLGHDRTQAFVETLLKTPRLKLKQVTKLEDLLSLLQLASADGVLASTHAISQMAERSRLKLHLREIADSKVGLPAVTVLNPRVRDSVLRAFKSLNSDTNRALGVDGWVER